jgi:hypothetical protein
MIERDAFGSRVIEVIESTILRRGRGDEKSPIRIITQYYTRDGVLLAESDPCPYADDFKPFKGPF